jgi:type VI secretion system Hcp family effector
MALNAFIQISKAQGESKQQGFEKWIEIQGWDWEVEAESSWTKGGGASVGKPNPGKFNFEHYYDKSSNQILNYICTGTAFDKIEMKMCKGTGAQTLEWFFRMEMAESFITKVSNSAAEDGNVLQKVEMVFKAVTIEYKPQGEGGPGKLGGATRYYWNIPEGKSTA